MKVDKTTHPNGCWLWAGSLVAHLYGKFFWKGKYYLAHRISYHLLKGAVDTELVLDHLCRNPQCVNPEHLEQVEQKENIRRGVGMGAKNYAKATCPRGHLYDGTFSWKGQIARYCRTCKKQQSKACLARQKANKEI